MFHQVAAGKSAELGMSGSSEFWTASAAIRAQEVGARVFDLVDSHPGSDLAGFYRGFTTSFRLKPGVSSWFHVPLNAASLIADRQQSARKITLLWDAEDDLKLSWATVHQGGADRIELTAMNSDITGEVVSRIEMPHGLSITMRQTEFHLPQPLKVRFGLQLCLLAESGERGATFRFYGAGVALFAS